MKDQNINGVRAKELQTHSEGLISLIHQIDQEIAMIREKCSSIMAFETPSKQYEFKPGDDVPFTHVVQMERILAHIANQYDSLQGIRMHLDALI